MKRLAFTAVVGLLVACASARPSPPLTSEMRSTRAPSDTMPARTASPVPPPPEADAWLPPFDPGPAGPIKVVGYPRPLDSGMSDPAQFFGWNKEGGFGYCIFEICCRSGVSVCAFKDDAGITAKSTVRDDNEIAPGVEKELRRLVAEEKLLKVSDQKSGFTNDPPPLTGDWAYARDITLHVLPVAASIRKDDTGSPALLRLGGAVNGEAPVWVWTSSFGDYCKQYPSGCMGADANGMALSPNGKRLGLVVYKRFPSHGSAHDIEVFDVNDLAARIYNGAGMRHHEKGDYARAAELFVAATRTNPRAELPLYNLACAWARLGNAHAKEALRAAIEVGGIKVAERARKDRDFESVRAEPWFTELTR